MNQNVLRKQFFLCLFFLNIILSQKALSQSCDNWLNLPSFQSYVSVGDLDVSGDKITVEATFIRTAPYSGGQVWAGDLVSKHNEPTDANYLLRPNNAEITTTNGYFRTPDICEIELNKIYHAAMVYDGATLKFYRNGFLMSSVAATGNMFQNNFQTRIGLYDAFVNNTNMIGYINEVRIWNLVRSQAQIRAFMNVSLPSPATQTGLLAYYTFNSLLNKQGNASWNGALGGAAAINRTIPVCSFVADSCGLKPSNVVTLGFIVPDTVCVNTPVNISNTSVNATSSYWNFCVADANATPDVVNLGNPGGSLSWPVFSDIVTENGNYYMFVSNNWPGGLVRLDFGNSLLNTPSVVNLGTVGGVIPNTIEGIQVIKNEGKWYALMVGGDLTNGGIPSRIIKIDFGTNITNANPVGTNWGNIGNLAYPTDLHVFQENGIWYGFTVNAQNNTITRFNFSASFSNTPTAVNLGNLGGLSYPTGINAIKDNGNWHVFITNDLVNSFLVRLDFGSSLLNIPTPVNLGNPGDVLRKTRDIYIMKACEQITALAVNGDGYSDLVKLDFKNNITSTPSGVSLGNVGNMDFPHSISKLFRVGNDLYTFVTNVRNHTLTRVRFQGCTNSSVPNSSLQNPPPITYTTPGTYNISLAIDDGLSTQSSVCKQIVVKDCTIPIVPDFDILDTVCVNTPVNITNTTTGATSHYWNFCVADPNKTPTAVNLGNPGGNLSLPVFTDIVYDNGNYYVFLVNYYPGGLVRLDFGNSLLNTPTSVNFGNFGNIIPDLSEGIQVVKNENKWYAIIVGGNPVAAGGSRIVKVDFGANINNPSPVATNWGNIGGLYHPMELHLFKEGNNWYGLTVNSENSTITRLSFGNSFDNLPTGVNLGNIGSLDHPGGINVINDNGYWRAFTTNATSNTITRLDFGTSMTNTPTGLNLGNPDGALKDPRDVYIMKECGETIAFVINGQPDAGFLKLDFNNDFSSIPAIVNFGNLGNMNFPHSISQLFRAGNDLYCFVPNAGNNTITRVRFTGCTSSSIPNSSLQNPPPITYTTPGTYNISLTIDDGLPTQSSVCKQIVVKDCTDSLIINDYTPVLSFDPCKNILNVENASEFNVGDTVLMIQMKGAIIDSTNTAAFGTIKNYRNAGNYEFNYVKSKIGNAIELLNIVERQYDIPLGKVQLVRVPYFQDYNATSVLTCLPWDGNKGGILVFNVQNALQLNANIDVSGRGFRGGIPVQNANYTCNVTDFLTSNKDGSIAAAKGEGIVETSTLLFGRGKISNGGGGGNSTNAGGAGGANGGNGGAGGKQYIGSLCNTNFVNGGIGGQKLAYSNLNNKVFLGGGGGAGHENERLTTPGGNGGGIVIIGTNSIHANSFKIISNGGTPSILSGINEDGRSGGGAGGSVLLKYTTLAGLADIIVKGGNGDNSAAMPPVNLHGPGGGGGGGVVWINKPTYEASLSTNILSGKNGTNININNDAWGAASGENGKLLNDLVLPVADVPFKQNIDSVRINKTAASCSSFDFKGLGYVNNYQIATWQWYFGDGGVASTQNSSHTYTTSGDYIVKLVITDINGCKDSITTDVKVSALNFDFSYKQDVCNPLTVQFNGLGNSLNNSFWNFGDDNTTIGNANLVHTYTATGNYLVKYSIGDGVCVDTIRKTISINILPDNLILTPDTTICYGSGKQLRTVPSLSFCWSPVTYLDDPNSPIPVTSATQDITYYFTAEVTGANLITNGDFSQGNIGFTSHYNYASNNTTEGQYFVGKNPSAWSSAFNSCGDHTSLNGNMMMVNAAQAVDVNDIIWEETVSVLPNTNYAFSTWILSLMSNNPGQVQFSINGRNIGGLINAVTSSCNWTQFYTTWNSGNNTTAVISIVNKIPIASGNDFALDDISFAPVFIKRDSVIIKVEKPIVRTNNDTSFCPGSSIQLNTIGAQNYLWSPATGLSNAGISNPLASPVVSTEYIVTGTTINGCTAKDTVNVNIYPKPVITLSADTTICKNALAQLSVTGGTGYSWSPVATLSDHLVANPVASPVVNTMYYVTVTDVNTCEHLDSVQVAIRPDAVFAINNPAPVCRFDSVQLNASGGDIYVWEPANGLNNTGITSPWVSPSVNTEYKVTITETTCNQSETLSTTVIVKPLPNVNAVKSNDIDCRNDQSQLTANGADQYLWAPSATLSNPVINNPVATPAIATQYIVTGTAANGCSAKDTIGVNVIPKATIVVSPGALICKDAPTSLFAGGGVSYSWFPAATLNNNLIANPVASPATSTMYYVTITDANNCEYLDSVKVSVRPDPAFLISDPGKVCLFDSVQLSANGGDIYSWQPADGLNNTNISNPWVKPSMTTEYKVTITETTCNQSATLSTKLAIIPPPNVAAFKSNDIDCSNDRSQLNAAGADQYVWTPAITLSNPGIRNPIATPLSTTEYIVKGTDATGCTGYDTITVKVDNINKGGYLMPNAFTPNNDGLNDCFRIKYWGVINDLEFSIYNRWGERIFFTRDAGQCWDGTYKGVQQDGGVYVYMIRAQTTCEAEVFRKGTFVLVR